MITKDHPFIKLVLGNLIHVTSIDGYIAISKDGWIRPNQGGFKSTWNDINYYYCQTHSSISLLDLREQKHEGLFKESVMNWMGVFSYHNPAIVLQLELPESESKLLPTPTIREVLDDGTKFIMEAEACYCGSISEQAISRIFIVQGSIKNFKDTRKSCLNSSEIQQLLLDKKRAEEEHQRTKYWPMIGVIKDS